jgi:hypothetical protein
VAVLLEEHPLEHASPFEAVARGEGRAVGEEEEDRVRLGEKESGLELQDGDPAVRVLGRNSGVRDSPFRMSTSIRSNGMPRWARRSRTL